MCITTTIPDPGASLLVSSNHGMRPATVLAMLGHDALVEYRMPGGTTALRKIDFDKVTNEGGKGKAIPYLQVSAKWLQAITDAGQHWIGHPQQRRKSPPSVPQAKMLLLQKRFAQIFCAFWRSQATCCLLSQIRELRGCGSVTGWEEGGCGIAAHGLLRWIRASPEYASCGACVQVRLRAMAGNRHQAAHVFVSVSMGKRELCLDPTGLRTPAALLRRWSEHYRLADAHIVPLGEDEQTFKCVRVPYSSQIGASVSVSLGETLGAFPLSVLFPS